MALVTLRTKYQFTLPRRAREELEWNPGDLLYVWVDEKKVTIDVHNSKEGSGIRISIRDRYQMTLPKKIYMQLEISESDLLNMHVDGARLIVYPMQLVASSKMHLLGVKEELSNLTLSDNESASPKFRASEGLHKLAKRKH
jgi:bifunctional DNA-binding transcriptional regulator/antitoxin component of YhaV-PrlF toxin-antitoxin module